MGTETTASLEEALSATEQKAAYDAACKRLLSEKVVLARIMQGCLAEYQNCTFSEVENCIEDTPQVGETPVLPDEAGARRQNPRIHGGDTVDKTLYEGSVTYDIRFQATVPHSDDKLGLIINIEAQNNFSPGYPLLKRGLYYCSRLISAQYGTEFAHSHYERIKKVYSIWVCTDPPQSSRNTITHFDIQKTDQVGFWEVKKSDYDLLSLVMIQLGGPGENYDGIVKLLDVLFSGQVPLQEKKHILQQEFAIQMSQTMQKEVTTMCNLSDGVEYRGILKGRAEGREEERERTVRSMRVLANKTGMSLQEILTDMDIPREEWEIYTRLVEKS